MVLDLNEEHEFITIDGYKRPFYRAFLGSYLEQAPSIKRKGMFIVSVTDILERRLHSTKSDWDNHFFTGDAIIREAHGDRFKVVRSAPFLRDVTPKSRLSNGTLVLADDVYTAVDGAEFCWRDLQSLLNCDLTRDKFKKHPVWQYLAGDQGLLDEYADHMFPKMRSPYDCDTGMGIYVVGAQNVPTAQAVVVRRLVGGSRFWGRLGLVDVGGRLVGVALEARNSWKIR